MKNKAVSWIMLTLLLMSILLAAFEIEETVRAEPSLRVTFDLTYYYPDGYVHGVPQGDYVSVDVYVDASALPDKTLEGMVGWGLFVIVDPTVLTPVGAHGGGAGYFLYDWSYTNYPPPLPGMPMPYPPDLLSDVGSNHIECAEFFIPLPPLGAGGTGKLCTLYFLSQSETAYSPIFIEPFPSSGYQDAAGGQYAAKVVNGHYNQPSYIYIRADGSVDPDTAPISTINNVTYSFTCNIYDEIIVERDNIVVEGAGHVLQGGVTGIDLSGRNNITIKNVEIKAFHYGILLCESSNNRVSGNNIANNSNGIGFYASSDNTVSGNNITANNWIGIGLWGSSDNTVSGNNITANNWIGIALRSSSNNTIPGNNITNNEIGIWLWGSINNTVYHNNFVDNTEQVCCARTNVWDYGYPSGGNYWSDHVMVDDCCGVNQDEPGSDGIVDEPYVIDEYNCDNYPLVEPWSPKTPSPLEATQELIETIKTWNLPKGIETSLTSILDNVLRLLDETNQKGVSHNLIALINQVEALEGKKLTDEQANHLIAEAQRIIDLLKGQTP